MMPTNPFPMAPNLPMTDHPDGASPNLYRPIDTALTQSVLLQPIHENHAAHDRRETYQHITTLEPFHNKMSIEYRGHQKFKKKRSKRRRKKRGRDDLEDDGHDVDFDDDEEYEIWRRPPADIDANNDGRHQMMMQYGNIEGMDPVLELLLEDETQCDVLERLMVNKRITTKDLTKNTKDRDPGRYQMFDILNLGDEDDDGGLDPEDYDIDMIEMEMLFNRFNNAVLDPMMRGYHSGSLPFAPRQPVPMGVVETDIHKQRSIRTKEDAHYIQVRSLCVYTLDVMHSLSCHALTSCTS